MCYDFCCVAVARILTSAMLASNNATVGQCACQTYTRGLLPVLVEDNIGGRQSVCALCLSMAVICLVLVMLSLLRFASL